jgi:phenylacetate-coenzyme A ligase PaaK-like adenylate-forming protein
MAGKVDESQWWSEHELRDFQCRTLRAIVRSAARDVPYYRDKYRPLGLDFKQLEVPQGIADHRVVSSKAFAVALAR